MEQPDLIVDMLCRMPEKLNKHLIKKGNQQSLKTRAGRCHGALIMMGTLLIAGTTLVLRPIMARKLGASESYQQLAENAAMNGLNRIISDLNKTIINTSADWSMHSNTMVAILQIQTMINGAATDQIKLSGTQPKRWMLCTTTENHH